jgi:hypothetical protein
MDPNTQHQFWGKWTVTVTRPLAAPETQLSEQSAQAIKVEWAKVVKERLGRTGSVQANHVVSTHPKTGNLRSTWELIALIEDLNQNDPTFERIARRHLVAWCLWGFGSAADVEIEYKRMAGNAQDGKPPEQMLILEEPIASTSKLNAP